jgi:hypothetical protein
MPSTQTALSEWNDPADPTPGRLKRKTPPDPLPKHLNRGDDAWYEYDGEPLFEEVLIERFEARFEEMVDYEDEIEQVSGYRVAIQTKDVDAFEAAIDTRFEQIADDHDFLIKLPAPETRQEGPVKTIASIRYGRGYAAAMGGPAWKRNRILGPVRDYELWYFHEQVIKPVFDRFHDRYPY